MTRAERGQEIKTIVNDAYDGCFMGLVSACQNLEELGCKAECKKLDSILGRLENVLNELSEKAARLM